MMNRPMADTWLRTGKLILALVWMSMTLPIHAQSYHFDVNNDGEVNVSDVTTLVNHILGNTVPEDTSHDGQQRKLTFKVAEKPLISTQGAKASKRLAPAIFTNTLDHFYINMMYYDGYFWRKTDRSETYRVTKTGYYENNEHWPMAVEDDDSVDVFGYYSYYKNNVDFFELNAGDPYLTVVTEESSNDQRDVIVARNTDSWTNCEGVVYLEFNHICSALQFSLKKTNTLANYTIEVSEVILHNVLKSGKYKLLGNEWLDVGNTSNFTLKAYQVGVENAITISETEETLLAKDENDYLFLIPQNLSGMAKGTPISEADGSNECYMEIKCKISEGGNQYLVGSANEYGSVYLPFSATLTAGHIHPFTINMGTALRDANGNKIFN